MLVVIVEGVEYTLPQIEAMVAKVNDVGQYSEYEQSILYKIAEAVTPSVLATLPIGVPYADVARKALQEWGGDPNRQRHVRWWNGDAGPYEMDGVTFDDWYAMAYRSSDGRHSTVEIVD